MSLLFHTLFRLAIAFLTRSKCLLISWPQSLSAVILEHKKIVCHCFHIFPLLFGMTHWKRPWCWKDWGQEKKGATEDEMVGWHHWYNGHEFEHTPGNYEIQGSLACCSPWGCKESDTTKSLNWIFHYMYVYIQYFGHLIWRADSLEKTDAEKDWMKEEMGMTEDEMVGWHHWYNGHEFEQTLGDGKGKGSLACSSPWGHKELDTT